MLSHSTLRKRFREACKQLGAPPDLWVYYTVSTGFGDPHVEISDSYYEYVASERNTEFIRRRTQDPDELVYWLVEGVVSEMATKFELHNRIPGQDSRRLRFQKELELHGSLNPSWLERKRLEINATLKEHPYQDRHAQKP